MGKIVPVRIRKPVSVRTLCLMLQAADVIQALFKVSLCDIFGEHVLIQGGNSTGVEAEFLPVARKEALRKHHVADAHGRGDASGKGV